MSSNHPPNKPLTIEEKDRMFKDRYYELYNHLEEGTSQGESGLVNKIMTMDLIYKGVSSKLKTTEKELKVNKMAVRNAEIIFNKILNGYYTKSMDNLKELGHDSQVYICGLELYKLNDKEAVKING